MKIDKAIMTVNENPAYAAFWPIVSKLWKVKFNIQPLLIALTDQPFDTTYGEVRHIQPTASMSSGFQALWWRFYGPLLEPDTIFITTDIDMLPISKYYFVDMIRDVPDDAYVHLHHSTDYRYPYPSCYHVAKGKKICDYLFGGKIPEDPCSLMPQKWWGDEEYCNQKLAGRKVHTFRHGSSFYRRIDRDTNWGRHDPNLVANEWYYDAHCPRLSAKTLPSIEALAHSILKPAKLFV